MAALILVLACGTTGAADLDMAVESDGDMVEISLSASGGDLSVPIPGPYGSFVAPPVEAGSLCATADGSPCPEKNGGYLIAGTEGKRTKATLKARRPPWGRLPVVGGSFSRVSWTMSGEKPVVTDLAGRVHSGHPFSGNGGVTSGPVSRGISLTFSPAPWKASVFALAAGQALLLLLLVGMFPVKACASAAFAVHGVVTVPVATCPWMAIAAFSWCAAFAWFTVAVMVSGKRNPFVLACATAPCLLALVPTLHVMLVGTQTLPGGVFSVVLAMMAGGIFPLED